MGVWIIALEAVSVAEPPRGKPIRPRTLPSTNALPAQTIITLPGGVTITNVPGEFLPTSTNTVRLPSAAARKFVPLGYEATSFTVLSRFFLNSSEVTNAVVLRKQIPADVQALDGKKIAIVGFTLPTAVNEGRATEFLLLRTQAACCFGMVPRVNEIVIVRMKSPGMTPMLDVPVIIGGVLRVKWIGEGGQLSAIYEMDADKVERAE